MTPSTTFSLSSLTHDPAYCLCTHLRKAARAVTQRYDAAFRRQGLRATQVAVLTALHQAGPVRLSQLANLTVTDRTTLTRNLALLARRGYVAVGQGHDRREHQARLTPAGQAALRQAAPHWQRAQRCLVEALGPARARQLLQDLEKVIAVCCKAA